LADSYGISRHTVYDVQARASAMLAAGVDTDTGDKPLVWVPAVVNHLTTNNGGFSSRTCEVSGNLRLLPT